MEQIFAKTLPEKPEENESKTATRPQEGVIFVQKTAKIHISSLINKIQSVANLSRPEVSNDASSNDVMRRQNDADENYSRQPSVDSSLSGSRISFNNVNEDEAVDDDDDGDGVDGGKKGLKRQPSKKRKAPVPPSQQQQNGGHLLKTVS